MVEGAPSPQGNSRPIRGWFGGWHLRPICIRNIIVILGRYFLAIGHYI